MTRKEFSDKSDALSKILGLCLLTVMLAVLGLTILGQGLSRSIEKHTNRWDAGSVFLLILMFGGLIGIACLEWRLARKWGLACPKCGTRFIDKVRRMVLLTGKCPKCKAEMFDDRAISTQPCSHGFNREEFKIKFENFTRESKRKSIRLLIFVIAAMLGTVPVSEYIQHLVDKGSLDWLPLQQWRWFVGIMLAAVFLSFISAFIFAILGRLKPRDLPCPACHRPLVGSAGRVTVESGMCVYCGCRLFELPKTIQDPASL